MPVPAPLPLPLPRGVCTFRSAPRTRTRRAKLYFIRRKATRDVARAMRRQQMVVAAPVAVDVPGDLQGEAKYADALFGDGR